MAGVCTEKFLAKKRKEAEDNILSARIRCFMRFTFGDNWLQYSSHLEEGQLSEARKSLQRLLQREHLDTLTFLDIGTGSGLFSIAAAQLGAKRVVAVDRDENCLLAMRHNIERFLEPTLRNTIEVHRGDILQPETCQFGECTIVYAWGSLHHTGAMWQALENAMMRCAVGGHFITAIYNHTFLSPLWLRIKQLYNHAPSLAQIAMVSTLWAARGVGRAISGKSPFQAERGMRTWYDAIDWLGGLPYEYASPERVMRFVTAQGFQSLRVVRTQRSGCNEFVFLKTG